MIKISKNELNNIENKYPGFIDTVSKYDNQDIPVCPYCKSNNTAMVIVGLVGRSIYLASATTRVHLMANKKDGEYFCNDCSKYFL